MFGVLHFVTLFYMPDEAPIIEPVSVKQEEAPLDSDQFLRRLACCIGYIPPLFFIPLWFLGKDEQSIFHGKQALVLTIFAAIVNVFGPVVVILTAFIGTPFVLLAEFILVVLVIVGMYRGYLGIQKPLPLLGGFSEKLPL